MTNFRSTTDLIYALNHNTRSRFYWLLQPRPQGVGKCDSDCVSALQVTLHLHAFIRASPILWYHQTLLGCWAGVIFFGLLLPIVLLLSHLMLLSFSSFDASHTHLVLLVWPLLNSQRRIILSHKYNTHL